MSVPSTSIIGILGEYSLREWLKCGDNPTGQQPPPKKNHNLENCFQSAFHYKMCTCTLAPSCMYLIHDGVSWSAVIWRGKSKTEKSPLLNAQQFIALSNFLVVNLGTHWQIIPVDGNFSMPVGETLMKPGYSYTGSCATHMHSWSYENCTLYFSDVLFTVLTFSF